MRGALVGLGVVLARSMNEPAPVTQMAAEGKSSSLALANEEVRRDQPERRARSRRRLSPAGTARGSAAEKVFTQRPFLPLSTSPGNHLQWKGFGLALGDRLNVRLCWRRISIFCPPSSTSCGTPILSTSCCRSSGARSRAPCRPCPSKQWRILCTQRRRSRMWVSNVARRRPNRGSRPRRGGGGRSHPTAPASPEGAEPDRRFDAPEWEQHPFFRLLKQKLFRAFRTAFSRKPSGRRSILPNGSGLSSTSGSWSMR